MNIENGQETPITDTTQQNDNSQTSQVNDDMSPTIAAERFAKLAAEEKKKVQERQKWQQERQAFESEKSEYMKYKEMIDKIKKGDVSVLDEINPDYYNHATQYKLNNSEPTIDYRLQSFEEKLLKAIDDKISVKEKEIMTREEENRKLQTQALRKSWVDEIQNHFKADEYKQKYPLLTENEDFAETVLEAIETARDKQKRNINVIEAAEILEKTLQDELKQTALKKKDKFLEFILEDMGISKEQFDKLTPKVKNELKAEAASISQNQNITLSNTPNSSSSDKEITRKKTKQELIDEAAKLIKFK